MKLCIRVLLISVLINRVLVGAAESRPAPRPLINAHAHNDYEHVHPLFDALDHGFCSIEADIYLVDGQLLVAHDRSQVKPERTLQALYLDPLRARIQKNHGRLYPGGPPAILLIDVKSEAEPVYAVLRSVLQQYAGIFTRFTPDKIETNALTAIISGNRPRRILEQEQVRYAALDGRPEDLDSQASASLIPLISQNWQLLFQWRGRGPFTDSEKSRLAAFVQKAHGQGRKVRFWGTPDQPVFWRELLQAHVDLINADDLAGLERFLQDR